MQILPWRTNRADSSLVSHCGEGWGPASLLKNHLPRWTFSMFVKINYLFSLSIQRSSISVMSTNTVVCLGCLHSWTLDRTLFYNFNRRCLPAVREAGGAVQCGAGCWLHLCEGFRSHHAHAGKQCQHLHQGKNGWTLLCKVFFGKYTNKHVVQFYCIIINLQVKYFFSWYFLICCDKATSCRREKKNISKVRIGSRHN